MRQAFIVAGAVFALGCMTPSPSERETLVEQVRTYHDALRWRRFEEAALALPPLERQRFLDRVRPIKDDIQISDYEVTRTEPKGADARIQVTLEWESKRTGLIRKTDISETWRRVDKIWILAEQKVVSGEPLPLLQGERPK